MSIEKKWWNMGEKGLTVVPSFSDPSRKKKTGSTRSWICIDSSGNDTVMDVDKYAIMRRVQIDARDLRILDPLLSYPSSIHSRERVIVLNLEHIKAIITAEEVLLRNPLDENVIPVVEELRRRLPQTNCQADGFTGEEDESPFEFRALEVALEAICSYLSARTSELESSAYPALDQLTTKISSRNLDQVRQIKSGMTRLTARVQKVRDELEHLLDDDDDMADLYLSRKLAGASSPVSGKGAPTWFPTSPTVGSKISKASRASIHEDHEEDIDQLEMLLEAYFSQIDGTLNKLLTLREYVDDTEDYIDIQLDNHRNKLIQLELLISAATLSLALHAMVSAAFGMNILYEWNEGYSHLFKWVVIDTSVVCAIVFGIIALYAHYKGLFKY